MWLKERHYQSWQNKLRTNTWFRRWWRFWSNYSPVFFIVAFLFAIFEPAFYQLLLLVAIVIVLTRGVAITLINHFYKVERPYQKYGFNPLISRLFSLKTDSPNSFPSRHAIVFAGISAVFMVMIPVVGLLLLLVTIMIGRGRVILGYHYPEDVIAGVVMGLVIGYLTTLVAIPLLFT